LTSRLISDLIAPFDQVVALPHHVLVLGHLARVLLQLLHHHRLLAVRRLQKSFLISLLIH